MSTDYPLGVLTDENKIRGYALFETLSALVPSFATGGIDNQIQARDFDPDQPQKVAISFDLTSPRTLPADFFEYTAEVTIDPGVPFGEQLATFTNCIGSTSVFEQESILVQVTNYRMTFTALSNLLKRLETHASVILPCLPVASSEEYEVEGPVIA
jgi:hypothetical protein